MPNYTIPYVAQFASRNPNTAVPKSSYLTSSPVSSIDISSCNLAASSNCYSPTGNYAVKASWDDVCMQAKFFQHAGTGGYLGEDFARGYCHFTGQEVANTLNISNSKSKDSVETDVSGKKFINGMDAVAQKAVTSDGTKIKWRTDKKKDTVSAALLIALGVAGIMIGGT